MSFFGFIVYNQIIRTRLYPDAKIKISSNNLTAHKSLVLLGCGIAVLPEFLIREELHKKVVVDLLPNEFLNFDLSLVERSTAVSSLNTDIILTALVSSLP